MESCDTGVSYSQDRDRVVHAMDVIEASRSLLNSQVLEGGKRSVVDVAIHMRHGAAPRLATAFSPGADPLFEGGNTPGCPHGHPTETGLQVTANCSQAYSNPSRSSPQKHCSSRSELFAPPPGTQAPLSPERLGAHFRSAARHAPAPMYETLVEVARSVVGAAA